MSIASSLQIQSRFLGPLRILLAEDNQVNRTLATHLFQKQGHTVVTVENGRAAAKNQSSDLALLDLQMLVMDGLQAVDLTHHHEEATGRGCLLVIALTPHAMEGDPDRCLPTGMDRFTSKPINRKELFAVIWKAMVGGIRLERMTSCL